MKHSTIIFYALFLTIAVVVAGKPVQTTPNIELAAGSDMTFGGTVSFDVTGAPAKPTPQIDIQCYGSVAGGTNNVGWWDTGSIDKEFVLGSQPTTAPPDLGSVIYLRWDGGVDMSCESRLFTATKKGAVSVLDRLTFNVDA